jgi:hypothetical protein
LPGDRLTRGSACATCSSRRTSPPRIALSPTQNQQSGSNGGRRRVLAHDLHTGKASVSNGADQCLYQRFFPVATESSVQPANPEPAAANRVSAADAGAAVREFEQRSAGVWRSYQQRTQLRPPEHATLARPQQIGVGAPVGQSSRSTAGLLIASTELTAFAPDGSARSPAASRRRGVELTPVGALGPQQHLRQQCREPERRLPARQLNGLNFGLRTM